MLNESNMDKVSVIIPTYKRPDKLTRAIDSVLAQTYCNIEVIVVDDNEPESDGRRKTMEIMLQYSDNPRVIYLKHAHNKNGSAARNTGAHYSKAKYIAFLDDDDEFLPGKIESQLRRFDELDESYACCYSKYATKTVDGKMSVGRENREGYLYVEALCRELCTMAGSNLLVKREAFEAIGGFDESFTRHQDVEFLTKMLRKYKMAFDNNLGLIVYVHKQDGKADYQKILDQYETSFAKYLDTLDRKVKDRFYYQINIQRFWDFVHTKHDFKSACALIIHGKVKFHNAIGLLVRKMYVFIRRMV